MPGIIPRARQLFASGFGYVAFLMAHIYAMVRLFPQNHVYLQKENIGKFGIRHVIAAAADNLIFKRDNWDQMVIFGAILTGVVLLIAQIGLLIVAIVFEPAFAQGTFSGSIFATPDPIGGENKDVAFLLLDRVFGVPELFCTVGDVCTDVLSGGRWPFHIALHEMFRFYSTGILIIATLIFLYFIVVVVAETATSGTPFGERFQNVWVPIRLVVALGLLIPVHHGLSSGQYIVLFAAKSGSGMATNGWHRFNSTINDKSDSKGTPLGESSNLLALPIEPDLSPIVQFMSLVHGCAYADWKLNKETVSKDDLTKKYTVSSIPPSDSYDIHAYFAKTPIPLLGGALGTSKNQKLSMDTTYQQGLEFYNNDNITIRFGRDNSENSEKTGSEKGDIEPVCGEITVNISDLSYTESGEIEKRGGGPAVQEAYFKLILQMWFGSDSLLKDMSHRHVEVGIQGSKNRQCEIGSGRDELPKGPQCEFSKLDNNVKAAAIIPYQSSLSNSITTAWENFNNNNTDHFMTDELLDRGWGGAGIWYNTISKINGGFVSAVRNPPTPVLFPDIMEKTRKKKYEKDPSIQGIEAFNPITSENENIAKSLKIRDGAQKAHAMYELYKYWSLGSTSPINDNKSITGNPWINAMNFVFGTQGIFSMRGKNAAIHPLAQLSSLGKGIIDTAIRNVAASTGLSIMGGLFQGRAIIGPLADLGSSVMSTTAYVALTAGITLFYVLPLLPFIFFFFAVGNWIKSIFEAMVGVPLWALAHMRIDGEGLPGQAAANGYFLILEIFIRPILIVFGLIAATVIFTAQVRILNFIWDMVVDNTGAYQTTSSVVGGGTSPEGTLDGLKLSTYSRGIVDQFFFTIIYVIVVYLMANASFKLIDSIPNNILRFAGTQASSFGDTSENPTEKLVSAVGRGGMVQGEKLVGAVQGVTRDGSAALGKVIHTAKTPPGK